MARYCITLYNVLIAFNIKCVITYIVVPLLVAAAETILSNVATTDTVNAISSPSHQRPPLYCGKNFLANRGLLTGTTVLF